MTTATATKPETGTPGPRRPHGPLLIVAALVVGGLALSHFAGARTTIIVIAAIVGCLFLALWLWRGGSKRQGSRTFGGRGRPRSRPRSRPAGGRAVRSRRPARGSRGGGSRGLVTSRRRAPRGSSASRRLGGGRGNSRRSQTGNRASPGARAVARRRGRKSPASRTPGQRGSSARPSSRGRKSRTSRQQRSPGTRSPVSRARRRMSGRGSARPSTRSRGTQRRRQTRSRPGPRARPGGRQQGQRSRGWRDRRQQQRRRQQQGQRRRVLGIIPLPFSRRRQQRQRGPGRRQQTRRQQRRRQWQRWQAYRQRRRRGRVRLIPFSKRRRPPRSRNYTRRIIRQRRPRYAHPFWRRWRMTHKRRRWRRRNPNHGGPIVVPPPSALPAGARPPVQPQPGGRIDPHTPDRPILKGHVMTTHHATEPVREAAGTLRAYEPTGPKDWTEFMDSLPEVFAELQAAFRQLGQKLGSDFPQESAVTQMWDDVASGLGGMGDHMGELVQTFRREHEVEIKRSEEPRPNEPVWDVRND